MIIKHKNRNFYCLATRRSSYRTRRRSHASNISSETDGHQSNIGSTAMEPPDEYFNGTDEDFDQTNFDDIINTRPFPWIKIIIRILNSVNLTCDHQIKCVSNCYDKQTSSCRNLIQALLNMYRLSSLNLNNIGASFSRSSSSTHRSTSHLKRNDTTSSKTQQDLKRRRVRKSIKNFSTLYRSVFFSFPHVYLAKGQVQMQRKIQIQIQLNHLKDQHMEWFLKQLIHILINRLIHILLLLLHILKNKLVRD
jgi:hypothetical protein